MHRGGVNALWLCTSGRSSWADTQAESKRAGLLPVRKQRCGEVQWIGGKRGEGLRIAEVTLRRGVHRNERNEIERNEWNRRSRAETRNGKKSTRDTAWLHETAQSAP